MSLLRQTQDLNTLRRLNRNSELRSIDPSVFRNPLWDLIDTVERDEMLGRLYSILVRRAKEKIQFYAELYRDIDTSKLDSMEDILQLPVVRKESTKYSTGLRDAIRQNRLALKPSDTRGETIFTTTGSTGRTQIPVFFVEPWDFEIESNAVARIWDSIGITDRDRIYNCYNPAHPGGYMFPGVARIVGASHRFKPVEFSSPEEVVNELREWRNARYPFTVLLAVPPDPKGDPLGRKGNNFETLYDEAIDLFGEYGIRRAFLVGGSIPLHLVERIEREMVPKGILVSGGYGTVEHRPLAFSPVDGTPDRVCHYNQQHIAFGPHYTFIGREDVDGKVVPINRLEEEGDVFTIGLRSGTPLILYKTGDLAKYVTYNCPCGRTTPVIAGIRRDDSAEIAGVGCRYE